MRYHDSSFGNDSWTFAAYCARARKVSTKRLAVFRICEEAVLGLISDFSVKTLPQNVSLLQLLKRLLISIPRDRGVPDTLNLLFQMCDTVLQLQWCWKFWSNSSRIEIVGFPGLTSGILETKRSEIFRLWKSWYFRNELGYPSHVLRAVARKTSYAEWVNFSVHRLQVSSRAAIWWNFWSGSGHGPSLLDMIFAQVAVLSMCLRKANLILVFSCIWSKLDLLSLFGTNFGIWCIRLFNIRIFGHRIFRWHVSIDLFSDSLSASNVIGLVQLDKLSN